MEVRTELFIFFGLALILFAASLVFFFSKSIQTTPPITGNSLVECNTLIDNGEGKIGTVFFSTEEQAQEYSSYLLSTPPFVESPEMFNFFFITPEQYKPECEIYKGAAVLCYSSEIIRKAASCPNPDYIVVIDKRALTVRSSSYLNVMSLNSRHALTVYLHEFGHAFANFAEEYKTEGRIPRGSKNCQSSCEGFEGEIDGCFQECTKSSYFRSIENGVMRTLSTSDYGLFNSRLIRELIEERTGENKLTGNAILESSDCADKEYFLIGAKSEEGKIQILSKKIETGCFPSIFKLDSEVTYRVYSGENLILEDDLNPYIFTDVQGQEEIEGQTFSAIEEGEIFYVTIPYTEDAESLELIDETTGSSTTENLQDLGGNVACHL